MLSFLNVEPIFKFYVLTSIHYSTSVKNCILMFFCLLIKSFKYISIKLFASYPLCEKLSIF